MAKARSSKIVTWVCDKEECNTRNTREILADSVIFDDVCDFCHKRIHEPLTIDLTTLDHKKKGKT